jgi:hypothetical protein
MTSQAFEQHVDRYDEWFERNRAVYESELRAVASLLPRHGVGIEIGVGTGRFAARLGIAVGVEPSAAMGAVARRRGIEVIQAVAECLPLADATFDVALMVTTLCFLDDARWRFAKLIECSNKTVRWWWVSSTETVRWDASTSEESRERFLPPRALLQRRRGRGPDGEHRVPGSGLGSDALSGRGHIADSRSGPARARAGLFRGSARHQNIVQLEMIRPRSRMSNLDIASRWANPWPLPTRSLFRR